MVTSLCSGVGAFDIKLGWAVTMIETARKLEMRISETFQLPTPTGSLLGKLNDLESDTSYVYTLNHLQSSVTHHVFHL